jgi:LPXTG-motif cell wall-anchored protein
MRNQRTAGRDQGTVRRKIATVAMAIGVVLFGIAVAPGVASAHHPLVTGKTQCRNGESWSVTWTARADLDRTFTWQITSPTGYSPSGSQADELPFTRTASYTGLQATESVSASWSNGATGSGSATVQRPNECATTTSSSTSTTTTTTTTTTQPTVTTATTQPTVTTATTQPTVTTTATTQPGVTTTVEQAAPSTSLVGQAGPTSTVDQSSGAAATTTDPIGRTLPATGNGNSSGNLVVIALTLIGVGAVMFRLASKPTR